MKPQTKEECWAVPSLQLQLRQIRAAKEALMLVKSLLRKPELSDIPTLKEIYYDKEARSILILGLQIFSQN
ncbi:hypothetical protein QJS04_geneDACA013976 [Acorus gramineus]|uniref:Uncharacterized protein n=1 Tax=Acorus gramineus TaxID=55184 RepID=A0AAV9AY59_ACOGR|nr:hypothetical protein QJS04_geneDACA013976 [Acorus gramineus]